ncbi:hypothetical protein [Roseateles amylovorans]|uniref:Uncharacterized protein n=1 Tax=Roseateles amylovorans TaxID=2978473 RepID=A0ABY6B117_9BURK|nr:hypothetical protein [Roseateles amylovorans]UXH79092.1 hypothetical protein N4261_03910 [Roseateles amylovorans]
MHVTPPATDPTPPSEGTVAPPPVRYVWWEKTVEYAFVRRVLPAAAAAFPLAGDQETSFGDLLLAQGAECRLIEFKKVKGSIQSEKKKFPEFVLDSTKKTVRAGSFADLLSQTYPTLTSHQAKDAHFFVYGVPNDGGFTLEARCYSSADGAKTIDLNEESDLVRLQSTDAATLRCYLACLDKVRGAQSGGAETTEDGAGDGGGSGSGGGGSIPTADAAAKADSEVPNEDALAPIAESVTFVLVSLSGESSLLTAAEFTAAMLKAKPALARQRGLKP